MKITDESYGDNWEKFNDPVSQKSFFYNKATGESSWNRPIDAVDVADLVDEAIKEEEDEEKQEKKGEAADKVILEEDENNPLNSPHGSNYSDEAFSVTEADDVMIVGGE